MNIPINDVKKLREQTNMSVTECKKALEQASGDFSKALEILKKKGIEIVEKKKERDTKEGLVGCYSHQNGKLGAIVRISCESDFVARNEVFKEFVHNVAMQIAAMDPKDVNDLMGQPFIKDAKRIIKDLAEEVISRLGENIKIEEFNRIEVSKNSSCV
jgi:elongation factor Ts